MKQTWAKSQLLITALQAIALILLAVLAWIPTAQGLAQPSADQVAEQFSIGNSCVSARFDLGWLGDEADSFSSGSSSLGTSQLMGWLFRLSCQLAAASSLSPLQSYLLLGLSLTFALSALACRVGGFRTDTSLLAGFLLTTAPCSFSRVGHLSLTPLWAVIPALMACHGLWKAMSQQAKARTSLGALSLVGSGALAALLCFPGQEYYVFFTVLLLLASYFLLLLLSTIHTIELRPLAGIGGRGLLFGLGFAAVVVLTFLPMISIAHGSGPGGAIPVGPPVFWASPRYAIEQFQYGLLPFTWLIPPPWVPMVTKALQDSGIPPYTESYFWSTGSFLIPMAWGCAVWILARRREQPQPQAAAPKPAAGLFKLQPKSLGSSDLSFFSALLGLVTFLGLLWMTMGGLGTLFAAVVSPVLRSLTRFTPFVYGSSVLLLLALLDLMLQKRQRESNQAPPQSLPSP